MMYWPLQPLKSLYMFTGTQRLFLKKNLSLNLKSIEYQTFFWKQNFVFSGVLWPYTMISVAAMVNTSWVYDPRLVSYALEQAERLKCHARANKVMHNFAWTPLSLYYIYLNHWRRNWTSAFPCSKMNTWGQGGWRWEGCSLSKRSRHWITTSTSRAKWTTLR